MHDNSLATSLSPVIRSLYTDNGCVSFTSEVFSPGKEANILDTKVATLNTEQVIQVLVKNSTTRYDAVVIPELGTFSLGNCKVDCDNILNYLRTGEKRYVLSSREGRLSKKTVIITGGASGFGKGIAHCMAEEGAVLGIADINYSAAVEFASALNDLFGTGTAIPIYVDVTSEESTEAMINEFVLSFGGLDVFIMSAGIAHGGGLEAMDMKTFELLTNINYKSIYIGTKYASSVMKTERKYSPGFTSDIIQINSKSGLDGSINNFAYAGSKFGGIGLIQSFAKELVQYGIKVNAICPGNYYDGPMWSDPKKGLFAQYLEVGKVPGAKTIDDVRKYHEDKTPMKRGCTPLDVARAVYYCIEQQYETGQAIPISGGQIMLK